jgi:hypothetical protein
MLELSDAYVDLVSGELMQLFGLDHLANLAFMHVK